MVYLVPWPTRVAAVACGHRRIRVKRHGQAHAP
jgi:hypothetical protein